MALEFDVNKVARKWEVCFNEDGSFSALTNAIALIFLHVKMSSLTEGNLDEFENRALLVQALFGPFLTTEKGPVYIREEEIRAHIGMTTNVTHLGRAAWEAEFKRTAYRALEDRARQIRRGVLAHKGKPGEAG